jgi:hypothetical protein
VSADPDSALLRRLRAALEGHAQQIAPGLVDEALAEATEEARGIIRALLTNALLEQAARHLPETPPARRRQAERPQPKAARAGRAAAGVDAAGTVDARSGDSGPATGQYVFGVVRAEPGRPEPPLTTVEESGLSALVQPVGRDEFRDRGDDLGWLERWARRHDEVLNAALAGGPVIPLRFGTVLPDAAAVRSMLRDHADELRALLHEFDGQAELIVKVLVDFAALHEWIAGNVAEPHASAQAAGPGSAYLRQRQAERRVEEQRRNVLEEVLRAIHERLSAASVRAEPVPVRDRKAEPALVRKTAYLVEEADRDAFERAAASAEERYGSRGLRIVITGPFPAHHFLQVSWDEQTASS